MRIPTVAYGSMIAFLCPVSDVDAGLLSAFAVDPNNTQVQYSGADLNGLSRSVDGGATWTTLWEGVEGPSVDRFVSDIVVDPHDGNNVYVGIAGQGIASLATGLAKSTDGGRHWNNVSPGAPVQVLAVSPYVPHRVFALSHDPAGHILLHKTDDGATSWSQTRANLPTKGAHIENIVFDPSDEATLYAHGFHGEPDLTGILFKSTDEGATWQTMWELKGGYLRAVLVDPNDQDILYAGSGGKVFEPGVFRSTDGGIEWTRLHSGNVVDLALDPDGPNSVFVGSRLHGLLRLLVAGPERTVVGRGTWGRAKNARHP